MKNNLIALLVFIGVAFAASPVLIYDAGSGVRDITSGLLLSNITINVEIWDSLIGGSLVCNETQVNGIQSGAWYFVIGDAVPCSLNANQLYYMKHYISGTAMQDYDDSGIAVNRRAFMSPVGSHNISDSYGVLPITSGGTGATTEAGAVTNILPNQTGNGGKYLTTDGSNVNWGTVISGIQNINGLNASTQSFVVGTDGSAFGINSSGTIHTFNLPYANSTVSGQLSYTDWSTFNSKVSTGTLADFANKSANEVITGNWSYNLNGPLSFYGNGSIVMDLPVFMLSNVTYVTAGTLIVNNSLCIYDITGNCQINMSTNGLTGDIVATGMISASTLKGDLNWSYLQNVPAYITNYSPSINDLFANKSGIGSCPAGYFVQNLTNGTPECSTITIANETDPIFMAENITIWAAITDVNSSVTDLQSANNTTNLRLDDLNGTLIADYYTKTNTYNKSEIDLYRYMQSSGMLESPNITNYGNGTIDVGPATVYLRSDKNFTTTLEEYQMAPATFTLVENARQYLVADYYYGTPTYRILTDAADITESDIIPVYTFVWDDGILRSLDWDGTGAGMINKIHRRLTQTQPFVKESGLVPTIDHGTVLITNGVVWYGSNRVSLSNYSSALGLFEQYYHVNGTWHGNTTQTTYLNSFYDNGTDLVYMPNNTWSNIWLYRQVGLNNNITYGVIDEEYFNTSIQAQADATIPVVPDVVTLEAVLVGRIVFKVNDTANDFAQLVTTESFSSTSSGTQYDHNNLPGLQGGLPNEYYHLAYNDFTNVNNMPVAIDTQMININTTVAPTWNLGRIYWDQTYDAMSIGSTGGSSLQVGQESYIKVYNNNSFQINDGQAVAYADAYLGFPTIELAIGNNISQSRVIGLATQNIPPYTTGLVTVFGVVHDQNTSMWSSGNNLYLSPTVAGGLTNIAPSYPNTIVKIGSVTKVNTTEGHILVMLGVDPTVPQTNYQIDVLTTITAQNIIGNLSASYVQNPPWLNTTDQRYNDTSLISSLNNLSLAIIGTNIGNWSADKVTLNNLSYSNISNNLGNWSADKASYATLTYVVSVGNWTNDKTSINNYSFTQIASNIGNWSAENASIRALYYSNISDLRTSNTTTNLRVDSLNTSKGRIGNCSVGQVVQNVTATGVQCIDATPAMSYGGMYSVVNATLTMTTQNVWYNVTNMTAGFLNNWIFSSANNTLTCNASGTYKVSYMVSGSVDNNDEVQLRITVNGTPVAKSVVYSRFNTNLNNGVSADFLQTFAQGDVVRLNILDAQRNGAVITLRNVNINMVRVGN